MKNPFPRIFVYARREASQLVAVLILLRERFSPEKLCTQYLKSLFLNELLEFLFGLRKFPRKNIFQHGIVIAGDESVDGEFEQILVYFRRVCRTFREPLRQPIGEQ